MDSENQTQVVKQKSEGRVKAGKQLAEWNRKNKENLLKNKTQDNPSEKSSNLSSGEKAPSYLSSKHYYYGGIGIALAAGIAIFYFWNQKPEKNKMIPPSPPPPVPKKPKSNFGWGA